MLRLIHTSADSGRKQSIDDEALVWVVRLTSGETTQDDHDAFRAWKDQSLEHKYALKRARVLHEQIGLALPRLQWGEAYGRRNIAVGVSIAASLLLMFSIGGRYASTGQYDYATNAGERLAVRLPDGTRLVMAGDTAFNVRYLNGVRGVELARGEALFEVVHEAERPFIVYAGDDTVRDIGTIFTVARSKEAVRVVVAQGSVEASSDERRTLLVANQAMSIPPEGGLGQVEKVDASLATSWTRGRLILQDKTLKEILKALAPHYSGNIVLLNRAAAQKRLSVVIDLDNVGGWLLGLAETETVRITQIGKVTILT